MKKIVRTVLLVILAIILIGVAIVCVYLFKPEAPVDDVRATITDPAGNTYVALTDGNGETYAAVAGSDGNVYQVEVNKDGSLGETKATVPGMAASDVITTYTGPSINDSVDSNAFTGSVVEVPSEGTTQAAGSDTTVTNPAQQPGTTAAQGTTVAPSTPAGSTTAANNDTKPSKAPSAEELNISRYVKMFSSGTYYMEFTTNDPELKDVPVITASKNGNVYVKTQMEGMTVAMLYSASKDKSYIVLDDYKKYCSVPESLMGDDFDMSELSISSAFASDMNPDEVTVSKVKIGGTDLICESYYAQDGTKMSYYFDDSGTLVRLDNVNEDGTATETYISKITNVVDDSVFEIPKGYGYLNLSWLNFLG